MPGRQNFYEEFGADELKMHSMGSTPGGDQVTEDTICSTEMKAESGHSALSELVTEGVLVNTCRCKCKGGSATLQCADIITSGSCYSSQIQTECAYISRLSCYIARRSGETTPYQSLGSRVEGTENGRAKKNGGFVTASIILALLAASGMLVQRTDAQVQPFLQVPPNNRIFGGKDILFPLDILLTRVSTTRDDDVIPSAMKMADCDGEEKGGDHEGLKKTSGCTSIPVVLGLPTRLCIGPPPVSFIVGWVIGSLQAVPGLLYRCTVSASACVMQPGLRWHRTNAGSLDGDCFGSTMRDPAQKSASLSANSTSARYFASVSPATAAFSHFSDA